MLYLRIDLPGFNVEHISGAPMYYSGIDQHQDNCYITTVNEAGDIVRQGRLPNVPDLIRNILNRPEAEGTGLRSAFYRTVAPPVPKGAWSATSQTSR